jgi:hypothetical protein
MDPASGAQRTWLETIDQQGRERIRAPGRPAGRSHHFEFDAQGDFMVRGDAPPPPSRGQIEAKFVALLDGSANRAEVADWAMQWVDARDPGDVDEVVWAALDHLAGADSPSTDRRYLYDKPDFEAWLDEVRGG